MRVIFKKIFDVIFANPSFIVFLVFLAAYQQCTILAINKRTGPPTGRHQKCLQMVLLHTGRHLGGQFLGQDKERGREKLKQQI